MTLSRLAGTLLLIAVGYHYLNQPLGFSVNGSIATAIFGVCLTTVYEAYRPDGKNLIGWTLIGSGCLVFSAFSSISLLQILPCAVIVAGYRMAALPFGFPPGGGDGGMSGDSDFGGCGGD